MEHWETISSRVELAALRARAVQAVFAGEQKIRVAQRFGVTRQTLHTWVAKHRRTVTAGPDARRVRAQRKAGLSAAVVRIAIPRQESSNHKTMRGAR
jgi:transposase-like protein